MAPGPGDAAGTVDAQTAPTAPWKTLRVLHELPQGILSTKPSTDRLNYPQILLRNQKDKVGDAERLERFIATELARHPGPSFSVLLVHDIGLRGDQKLVEIGAVVRRSLRPSDEIVYLGKQEFVVLMPRTDERACAEVTEIVSRTLERSPVTIGGASSPDDGSTVSALLRTARERLATRSNLGENRSQSNSAIH